MRCGRKIAKGQIGAVWQFAALCWNEWMNGLNDLMGKWLGLNAACG